MMTIAAADDELRHEDAGLRDHAELMSGFESLADKSPGMSLLAGDMAAQFLGPPESSAPARDRYYRSVIELLMDGLEASVRRP